MSDNYVVGMDLNDLESEEFSKKKDSKNTSKVIEYGIKLLRQFCKDNKCKSDVEKLSKIELDQLLAKFWSSIRTENGSSFKKNTFKSLRYGILTFLKSQNIDISNEAEFARSNKVYRSALLNLIREGHGDIKLKVPLTKEDINKLYNHPIVFSTETPTGLQNKVFFEVMLYLCRCGRENLREHTKNTFVVKVDPTGRKYVCHSSGEVYNKSSNGRMYALEGNPRCPVVSFELYVSKLHPECDSLWQRPLKKPIDDDIWYHQTSLGKFILPS